MINPFQEIDWNPDLTKRREFGRVLFIGFDLIAALLLLADWLALIPLSKPLFLGAVVGAFLGLLAWLFPRYARPLYVVWYALGACVGIVTSNLLLTAAYYIILTPFALFFRLIRRDPLHRRYDPGAKSYWESVEPDVDPKRYFRQF
jgi:hypothetical protein